MSPPAASDDEPESEVDPDGSALLLAHPASVSTTAAATLTTAILLPVLITTPLLIGGQPPGWPWTELGRSRGSASPRVCYEPARRCRHESVTTEMIRRPLMRTLITRAPIRVPMMVPRPPSSEVPPMMTAAMACSSYPRPSWGWAESRRDAMTTPATPVNTPANV